MNRKITRGKSSSGKEQTIIDFMVKRLKSKITKIVSELTYLSREKDEDSKLRLSELTQDRDRLTDQLDQLKSQKSIALEDEKDGGVNIGNCVTLKRGNENMEVCLVNGYAIDASAGAISITSPLGKGLLHRKPGDRVEVKTPSGQIEYEIVKIN